MDRKRIITEAEAICLAREKYPECYEIIDIGEGFGKQCVDINALNRAAYGAHLLKGVPVGNKNP